MRDLGAKRRDSVSQSFVATSTFARGRVKKRPASRERGVESVTLTTTRTPGTLTSKQRSFLRALAHPLKPIVQIGHGGLTEAVVKAIDLALQTHELIKVKVTGNDEVDVEELAPEIEKGTRSSAVQVIGKTLVLYRPRKKDPVIVLPKSRGNPDK
jgi:RNA-binding protein